MKVLLWSIGFVLAVSLGLGACGKKTSEMKTGGGEQAKQAALEEELTSEESPFRSMIENAGFEITLFKRFPSEEQGIKGRVLLYSEKKRNGDGGIIYFKKLGDTVSPAWHWYLEGFEPESIYAEEINEDGLWDIRVTSGKQRPLTFIQDTDFTLAAKPRDDFLALNGTTDPQPVPDHPLWHCFDGDSATTWDTMLGGGGAVTLKLKEPFGVVDGVLTIETAEENQPKEVDVYAGDKKIDTVKLKAKAGMQVVRLSPSIQGAKDIRLVFKSSYGKDDRVAIAELGLK
jgi:hypothetical protein